MSIHLANLFNASNSTPRTQVAFTSGADDHTFLVDLTSQEQN
jgi:hypothetical protein